MDQQRKRIITAAIGIPVLLLLVWLGGWWLGIAVGILAILGGIEYYRMLQKMHLQTFAFWLLLGCAYIALGFLAFFGTKALSGTLWLLLIIWSTDTAAYEFGRRFGRTPLASQLSPNKTVEGALAGVAGGLIVGLLYGLIFMKEAGFGAALLIPLLISIIGQIGDLLESKFKRMAGVKDSANIFPGHGGVLDRFDSILLAAPFMYVFLLIMQ